MLQTCRVEILDQVGAELDVQDGDFVDQAGEELVDRRRHQVAAVLGAAADRDRLEVAGASGGRAEAARVVVDVDPGTVEVEGQSLRAEGDGRVMPDAAADRTRRGHVVVGGCTLEPNLEVAGGGQIEAQVTPGVVSLGILGPEVLQVASGRRVRVEPQLHRAVVEQVVVRVSDQDVVGQAIESDGRVAVAVEGARLSQSPAAVGAVVRRGAQVGCGAGGLAEAPVPDRGEGLQVDRVVARILGGDGQVVFLVGADVGGHVGARDTALVRRRRAGVAAFVDAAASGEQGVRLGGPAIVGERVEEWRHVENVAACKAGAAVGVADEIVTRAGNRSLEIRFGRSDVAGNDRVADREQRAAADLDSAGPACRRVVRDGDVLQRGRVGAVLVEPSSSICRIAAYRHVRCEKGDAVGVDAAAVIHGCVIAADGDAGERCRAGVVDATAVAACRVGADRAVRDDNRAVVVDAAADVRGVVRRDDGLIDRDVAAGTDVHAASAISS